jgi:uroporphyrinogen-III synthase
MRILFTNHVDESHITLLRVAGISADIHPFIQTDILFDKQALYEQIREYNPQVIAISSKNAIAALKYSKDLLCDFFSVCTISQKLAAEIQAMGIKADVARESNSGSLAEMIHNRYPDKRILHLCGNLRKEELTEQLRSKGAEAEFHEVYETRFLHAQIDPSVYDVIVFTSYSAIDSFYQSYAIQNTQTALTIGPKTTDHLKRYFDGQVLTSGKADLDTIIQELLKINETS